MRTLLFAVPLMVTVSVQAQTSVDADAIAKAFNSNLSGVTLCDPKANVIAEVDDGQGGKKLVRTAQNTWADFKPEGKGYSSSFTAFHRNSKTGEVKPNKMILKLVPEGSENIDPVSGKKKVQLQLFMNGALDNAAAKYDVSVNEKGDIDILETSSKFFQFKRGKENLDKGAMSYATNIKVSKTNGKTNYVMDELSYVFTNDQVKKAEEATGKKFFTDTFNEKTEEFNGFAYNADDFKKIADSAGVKAEVKTGTNWSNCPDITEEDALKFAKGSVEKHNLKLKSKKGNTFKSSERKSLKGEKQEVKSEEKKATSIKAKVQ